MVVDFEGGIVSSHIYCSTNAFPFLLLEALLEAGASKNFHRVQFASMFIIYALRISMHIFIGSISFYDENTIIKKFCFDLEIFEPIAHSLF